MSRPSIASLFLGLILTLCQLFAGAAPVSVKPDHPDSYTVRTGDTLWDISGMFLQEPWRWREIWQTNPQIKNPDLIFPGDTLHLNYTADGPRLTVQRGLRTVKLTPQVRIEQLETAIPTIPIDSILPFLTRPFVLNDAQLQGAPYVVDFVDERIRGGAGDSVYVRSIEDTGVAKFEIVRPGDTYTDPDTGEELGYAGNFVAEARLERPGDPAKLFLTEAEIETQVGDLVLPASAERVLTNFFPKPAPIGLQGRIIGVLKGVSQIGQFNVVVLNRGSADGLSPGDVMQIFQGGNRVRDKVAQSRWWLLESEPFSDDDLPPVVKRPRVTITLPYEESGVLMVFRTFDRVSFALVMHAFRPIHVHDAVRAPDQT